MVPSFSLLIPEQYLIIAHRGYWEVALLPSVRPVAFILD